MTSLPWRVVPETSTTTTVDIVPIKLNHIYHVVKPMLTLYQFNLIIFIM